MRDPAELTNAFLAERLDALAVLLDLAGASPFSARAYRRAAALVRATPADVAALVRSGRVRELRGIGRGIEAKLGELVETGRLVELEELERTVRPEVVGFGRFLGLSSQRALELARALGVTSAEEFRAAIEDGRVASVRGVGPKTEARLRAALVRPPEGQRRPRLLLNRARTLLERIADGVGAAPAGDPRRWVDAPQRLVVLAAAVDPEPVIDAFVRVGDVVAVIERSSAGAVAVTTEGLPVELVVAPPSAFGTALLRATGSDPYVASLGELPDAATEEEAYRRLGRPFLPPDLRELPAPAGDPPRLLEVPDVRGDLHCHTTWSDGRASVLELGRGARGRGYEYVAICDHTPSVRVVPGVTADDLRRQGEEIAAANEELAPFRILRGVECDILPDGSLDLPDDVLAELEWVTASVHAGQRTPRLELTKRVTTAMRHPAVRALSHPTGRLIGHRPPNALDLEETIAVAVDENVALEVNGLPDRLDLRDDHVRLALEGGAKIVVNTDAHSIAGLGNMPLAVHTARRGWARPEDVVNTLGLDELLGD